MTSSLPGASNPVVVLAVDDEEAILRLIRLSLAGLQMRIITAKSGEDALRLAEQQRPDLVLLDLQMPEVDGFEVMRLLRDRTNVPIIVLTALGHDADRTRGLDLGADDYVTKPFDPAELSARVRAVLRRSVPAGGSAVLKLGDLEIDLQHRKVSRNGAPIGLTRTEWQLLTQLASNPGKTLLTAELLSSVWGPEFTDDVQYLRVWMSRLRLKLETDRRNPKFIKTAPGLGYLLDVEG